MTNLIKQIDNLLGDSDKSMDIHIDQLWSNLGKLESHDTS